MGLFPSSSLLFCTFLIFTFGSDIRHPPHFLETETASQFYLTPDNTLQFKCKAHGVPNPTVEWVQTKSNAPDPTRKTMLPANGFLPPNEFTANMQGDYQCVAKNVYGTAISNKISLNLAQDTVFDINARTFIANGSVGDPVRIPCSRTRRSVPKANYEWRVHENLNSDEMVRRLVIGSRINIDNDGTLYFAYTKPADEMVLNGVQWTYMCYSKNPMTQSIKYGSPTKIKLQPGQSLTVRPPRLPTTLQEDNEIHILEGKDLDLFCFFDGYPEVKYSWKKTTMPAYVPEHGATRITIKGVKDTPLYNGEYICVGQNSAGQASITYRVIVDVPPYFDNNPDAVKDNNATCGSTIELKCIALGKPLPTIEWRRNNQLVTHQNKGPRVSFTVDGNQGTFKIENVQKGDGKTESDVSVITCYAKSPIGERYGSGYINVFNPIKILTPPKSVILVSNDMVINLDCGVTSDPNKEFHVEWYHNKVKIIGRNGTIAILPNNTLRIYVEKYTDSAEVLGNYSCHAITNTPFQQITKSALILSNGSSLINGSVVASNVISTSGSTLGVPAYVFISLILVAVVCAVVIVVVMKSKKVACFAGSSHLMSGGISYTSYPRNRLALEMRTKPAKGRPHTYI